MEKSTSLTRVCIVCGEEKSLSAYLQISGAQGTLYGNVCAECRAANANKSTATEEDEDSGGSGGHRIDSKSKIQAEEKDKKQLKQLNELNKKEAKERAKIVVEKTERTEIKEKGEKDHREQYIEGKKKHDFLSYQSKKTQQATAAKKSQTQQAADTRFTSEQERQSAETKTQKDEVTQEEQKKSTIDLSAATFDFDPQRSGLKYGEIFRQWVNREGTSLAAPKTLQSLYGKTTAAKPSEKPQKTPDKPETPSEFVEKNWGPSSTKGR